MFQDRRSTWIVPKVCHGIPDFGVERGIWVGIDIVFQEEGDIIPHFLAGRLQVKLVVGPNQRLRAVHEVLVYGQTV